MAASKTVIEERAVAPAIAEQAQEWNWEALKAAADELANACTVASSMGVPKLTGNTMTLTSSSLLAMELQIREEMKRVEAERTADAERAAGDRYYGR